MAYADDERQATVVQMTEECSFDSGLDRVLRQLQKRESEESCSIGPFEVLSIGAVCRARERGDQCRQNSRHVDHNQEGFNSGGRENHCSSNYRGIGAYATFGVGFEHQDLWFGGRH